jgi:hypothetical protein
MKVCGGAWPVFVVLMPLHKRFFFTKPLPFFTNSSIFISDPASKSPLKPDTNNGFTGGSLADRFKKGVHMAYLDPGNGRFSRGVTDDLCPFFYPLTGSRGTPVYRPAFSGFASLRYGHGET